MENILYVNDNEIKRTKSSFSIYKNEHVKYEGKYTKVNMERLIQLLQVRNTIMDAIGYQVLNAVYELTYSTSRQITEYINLKKKISVTQDVVSKKLHNLNNLSIVTQQSFISEENTSGTNMKFYCLDKNGKNLLLGSGFKCNWKPTDALDNIHIKAYLVRNQYAIKLYKECPKLENIILKKLVYGVGLTYNLSDSSHVIIPVRNNINYEEELLKTFENMYIDSEISSMINKKIIIIGEDSKHIFNIFKFLSTNKLMDSSTYFATDLKLFDRKINEVFVRFGVKKNENGIDIVMIDENLKEFINYL